MQIYKLRLVLSLIQSIIKENLQPEYKDDELLHLQLIIEVHSTSSLKIMSSYDSKLMAIQPRA